MNILGISAFYHDSAAALVCDGKIIAAAQEERFTRKKHDSAFPQNAIEYCLKEACISYVDLDHVAFYDKPLLKFERLLETYFAYAPAGFRSFLQAMPLWLREKLHLPRLLDKGLDRQFKGRYLFLEHHESHAASAFFPSPFEEAAILTVDGVGEWATSTIGVGVGNKIQLTHEQRFPHSLGLLYSAFTYYCGFRVNSGEYKLMGLAPYGEPRFAEVILSKIVDLRDDGSFRMDMQYFNYCQGLTMTNGRFDALFGQPPRHAEGELTEFYMDIAASIQKVTEEIMLRMTRHAHAVTKQKNLCLAGGVALNCVCNGRILREGPFENIWIQPAAGDAGGALGAALFVWYQLLDNSRAIIKPDAQQGSLLGPDIDADEARAFLDSAGAVYQSLADDEALYDTVAGLIADEKVIGWVQGRMEFGPRALGSRSILGDARSTQMQKLMNLKIKFRESFRPFAPVVLRERVHDYFEMRDDQESPYMLLVAQVHPSKRTSNGTSAPARGLAKLEVERSTIPAVTHVDLSARIQTVDAERHGRFYELLKQFEQKSGCPVLINTSFNIRGEPIVCTAQDAYRCFMATNMDVLVVGRFLLRKDKQPHAKQHEIDQYLAKFQLD
ncbi:MAG: carbamoyltransferase [Verrucomicrobiota bacterium]